MAAYDLEEQEQIDALKAWWAQNGRLVILGVVVFALAVAAFYGWRHWKSTQANEASTAYARLVTAVETKEGAKVREVAAVIMDKYGRTGYGAMAALVRARFSFDAGDLADAKTALAWAIEQARDDEVRDIARLRLATVLFEEKKFDEALKHLSEKHLDTLANLYAELKGDILAVQGKPAEARSAYQVAYDRSDPKSPYRNLVQIKLDAIGEVK